MGTAPLYHSTVIPSSYRDELFTRLGPGDLAVCGVKVRIIVSDPQDRGTIGSGGYSQIKALSEVSDAPRGRVTALTGDGARARAALCENLQSAIFRTSDAPTWADGKPYAQHHKLVSVDGAARRRPTTGRGTPHHMPGVSRNE
ncbi:hypothetical protein ACIQV3_32840 [Streptomyces sp. NPDC099050]|uniref:hypothetical protein n=1 Tax=Streptomyces sp. NPDC099050 TaxID=3366100 RepID=UPI0037FF8EE1